MDDKWTPNYWTLAWGLWVLAFVVLEAIALRSPSKHDTLSEQIWGAYDLPGYGKFFAWLGTFIAVWATVHFLSRGRWG